MLRALLAKELRLATRARRVRLLGLVTALLAFAAALSGHAAHRARVEEHRRISGFGQRSFEEQKAAHPHSVAHNGYLVSRPPAPLGFLDAGVDAAYGSWVRLDAHRARFLQGARLLDLSRGPGGGRFDLGLLLAIFAPALVLILGFDLVAGERARGTLTMLLAGGLSRRPFLLAKGAGLLVRVALAVLLPAGLAVLFALLLAGEAPGARLLLWLSVHLLSLSVWALIALWVTTLLPTPRSALLAALGLWGGLALLLPPLAGSLATALAPLPALGEELVRVERWAASAHAADEELRARAVHDIQRRHPGWDGQGEAPEAVDAVMLRLADQEVAARVEALLDRLGAEDDRQERAAVLAALPSPTGLASLASSAVAGSDLAHMRRFFRHFERYRQELMRWLNEWWAKQGAAGAEPSFAAFAEAPRPPPLAPTLGFAVERAQAPLLGLAALALALLGGLLVLPLQRREQRDVRRAGPMDSGAGAVPRVRARGLLSLELLQLLRSARARVVLLVFAALSALALALGAARVGEHARLGARDQEASRARVAAGAAAGSSAFELAAWNEGFLARTPGWSAAFAAGELALLPDSAGLRLIEPPTPVPALAERAPAALLLGALDLAWVLLLLLPLGALALGFDLVARDREQGTLAMLLAPARRPLLLLLARGTALFVVLWLAVVPVAAAATLLLPAALGGVGGPGSALAALLVLSAYLAYLAALVLAATTLSDRTGSALALGLGAFLLLHLALPLGVGGLGRLLWPYPDPRATLEAELAAQDVFQRPSAEVLDREAARDPPLDPSLATDGVSSQNRYFLLLARERLRRAKAGRFELERLERRRQEWGELVRWLSPAGALGAGLAALAPAGLGERARFLAATEQQRQALEGFVRERVVQNEGALRAPQQWPHGQYQAEPGPGQAVRAALVLLGWTLVLTALAGVGFTRMSLAPSRGES